MACVLECSNGGPMEGVLDEELVRMADAVGKLEWDWEEDGPQNRNLSREPAESDLIAQIAPFHDGPLGRCPTCGARVFLPCVACRCIAAGDARRTPPETWDSEDDPSDVPFEFTPQQQTRYEEIRKLREAGCK